jgi:hypothetical protein
MEIQVTRAGVLTVMAILYQRYSMSNEVGSLET